MPEAPAADASTAAEQTTEATTETAPVPTAEQAAAIAAEDPSLTISRLEAEVKAARQEAGKARINAKTAAADEARAELAQTVGKALGLVTEDDAVDPAKLVEQATAAQAQAKQAQVELAVFRAAEAAGGDPVALLDSRTFLESAAQIDPTDSTALVAAITEAVTANPRLGKATPAPGMKPNPAQGRSASPTLGLADQIAQAEAAGDVKRSVLLKSASIPPPK